MTITEPKNALVSLIKQRSFQSGGEVKLASGRTSSFYFNMKPTMMHPQGALLIATMILDQLEADGIEADLIGGLEMGAVPLAAAVAAVSATRANPLPAFFVRKQPKEHGTQSLIEGLARGEALAGKAIVIVEDVTTTGGSAIKASEVVEREGGKVVRVVTVVDRREGATEAFAAANLDFKPLLTIADFGG